MTDSILSDVNPDHRFILSDGRIIKNLEELSAVLPTLSKEEFDAHVSKEHNDFKNWIGEIVKDEVLVKAIGDKTKRKAIQNLITKRVVELKRGTDATPKPQKVKHMLKKLRRVKVLKPKEPKSAEPIAHVAPGSLRDDTKTPYVRVDPKCLEKTDLKVGAKEFMQGVLMGFFIGLIVAFFFI